MCGQGGVAGSIDGRSEKVFQRLLIYNSVRGTDSTGAASVKRALNKDKEPDIWVAKEIGHPFNLLNIKRKDETDFSDILSSTHRVLMGHCRASTRGASTRFNAHPFCFNSIVGTHNGTLGYTSHHKLAGHTKFDTDSEAIFNEIEAFGIAETVKHLQGYKDPASSVACPDAYALVWYDGKDNTINFLRNRERPLCFAFDKKKEQLFWSSEDVHLMAAMADVPHEDKFIYYLPMDEHYSWVLPSFGQAFGKAKVARREGHKENPFHYTTNNRGGNSTETGNWNGDSRFSWPNKVTGFWEKYNSKAAAYRFAENEHGPWFDTLQQVWDSLPENVRFRRVIAKEIPVGVISGFHYDYDKNCHVKTPAATNVPVSNPIPPLLVTVKQENITKLFDEVVQKKLKEAMKDDKKCTEVYKDNTRKAYFDQENKNFILFTFMGMHSDPPWDRQTSKNMPNHIPFTNLDIEARHQFRHIGKGKKRVTYYVGFNNEMLVRPTFERLMHQGCAECFRNPTWGNEVQFISKDMFVCEYCSKDLERVKVLKDILKEKGTGNAG